MIMVRRKKINKSSIFLASLCTLLVVARVSGHEQGPPPGELNFFDQLPPSMMGDGASPPPSALPPAPPQIPHNIHSIVDRQRNNVRENLAKTRHRDRLQQSFSHPSYATGRPAAGAAGTMASVTNPPPARGTVAGDKHRREVRERQAKARHADRTRQRHHKEEQLKQIAAEKAHEREKKVLEEDEEAKKAKERAAELIARNHKIEKASKEKVQKKVDAKKKRKENRHKLIKSQRAEQAKKRRAHRAKLQAAQASISRLRRKRMRERKAHNHDSEPNRRMHGLCAYHKALPDSPTPCPMGWKYHGVAGLLVYKGHVHFSPFHKGEWFNKLWRWVHPVLCCAHSTHARLEGLFGMGHKCPASSPPEVTDNLGLHGLLLRRSDYHSNPFHRGSEYNDLWRWAHPYLCGKVRPLWKGVCLLGTGKRCPQHWKSHGMGALVVYKTHYKQLNPFLPGRDLNTNWRWAHPLICCWHNE